MALFCYTAVTTLGFRVRRRETAFVSQPTDNFESRSQLRLTINAPVAKKNPFLSGGGGGYDCRQSGWSDRRQSSNSTGWRRCSEIKKIRQILTDFSKPLDAAKCGAGSRSFRVGLQFITCLSESGGTLACSGTSKKKGHLHPFCFHIYLFLLYSELKPIPAVLTRRKPPK